MRHGHRRFVVAIVVAMIVAGLPALSVSAVAPQRSSFERTWQRTDQPVANQSATRTWMWGPGGFTSTMLEWYDDAPGGERLVQYFDKSRMEDNSYRAPDAPWDVSNGLLVKELITGQMQFGDNSFATLAPANVNVAGDPDDTAGPTYSTFTTMLDLPPYAAGATISQRVSRDGTVSDDPSLAQYGVTAGELVDVPGISHRVASVFWTFMTSSGQVYENGQYVTAPLFQNPYYATGLPITEAYWANVKVGGTVRLVLIQCFERRCLTFTPDNPAVWQVEMGNVGQHYYIWRYDTPIPSEPPLIDTAEYVPVGEAPMVVWPFPQEGQAFLSIQNDSPYTMQVIFDGPTSHTMTIAPYPAGQIWPSPGAFPGCSDDAPFQEVVLPAGNYRVQMNFLGGNVIPGRAYWTLVPDAAYAACYFVTDDIT